MSSVKTGSSAENWAKGVELDDSSNTACAAIWADPNTAGGGTTVAVAVAFGATASASNSCEVFVDVFEFSGVAASSAVDQTSTGAPGQNSSAWSSGATGTTSQASEIAVGTIGATALSGTSTVTGPSGSWVNESTLSGTVAFGGTSFNTYAQSGYQILSSTGTVTYSGTTSASTLWDAVTLTLKVVTAVTSTGAMALNPSMSGAGAGGNATSSGGLSMARVSMAGTGSVPSSAANVDPAWLAARCGLPGDPAAVNEPSQAAQFLAAHAITPVYAGAQIIAAGGFANFGGPDVISLAVSDVDQPFTMPGGATAIGRVTLPLSPVGNGADVTVSLCANSGGSPGAVIASTRVPASCLAQLAAPNGFAAGGPLATAQSNQMLFGQAVNVPWAQPAVSLNGSGTYAAPVTSGSYTILLGGYDSTASAAVGTVATIASLGGGAVSGPVPQPSVPQGAYFAMAAATADTVIFAGGTTLTSHYANVWTASWDPATGTVGAWTAQAALPAANVGGGMATWGSFAYVAGGDTASSSATSVTSVWYASAVNGQIQSWTAGPALPQALSNLYAAAVNGWLIVAGGQNTSGTAQTAVWYSAIKADGSLGGWQPGPPLPTPAYALAPGWNLAVTDSAIAIVSGLTTGGAGSFFSQTLTVTPDGPAPAWQSMDVFTTGGFQTAAYQGAADGQWDVFNLHLTSYDVIPFTPLPMISVPLPASGLTSGGTYHIVFHQDGGDLNDFAQLVLDPASLPIAAQTRPAGGGSWTGLTGEYAVMASVWDQTPGGPVLHTWEDSGARVTEMVYAGSGGQLLGILEATAFEDGTMLPVVTEIGYSASGLPTGLTQLA